MLKRFYHCSCVNFNKKQGVKLCKMINLKNKKQWYPSPQAESSLMPSVKSLTKSKYEPAKQGARRIAMLNKLFMKNITDLMSTGTVSMDIVGRGIEISQVKVTPDFQTVNVFWVCKGNSTDKETEIMLNSIAGPLRHELSTLRLMGEVPYVVFVKDRLESQLIDLDRRLAIADYGEDHTPTELGHILKTEFTLNTRLSPEMKAKIKQLEDQEPIDEEPLPEMTQNVFGLDHSKIMGRLMASRKKTRDAWSNLESNTPTNIVSYRMPAVKGAEIDTGKQKKELAEFLLKRQIDEKKLKQKPRDPLVNEDELYKDSKEETQDQYEDEDYEDYDDFYDDVQEMKAHDTEK